MTTGEDWPEVVHVGELWPNLPRVSGDNRVRGACYPFAMKRIKLSDALWKRLQEPITGEGGFQALARKLQHDNLKDGEIEIDDEVRRRLIHYAYAYGSGGWQNLFKDLLAEIDAAAEQHP